MFPPKPPRVAFTGVSRFPCHSGMPAYLLHSHRDSLRDEWEQECPAWQCRQLWRFVRESLTLHWLPITELTEPRPMQQTDPLSVEARMLRAGREYLRERQSG